MESKTNIQQDIDKSVLIVNCPLEEYGDYIVSATSSQSQSSQEYFLSFYYFDNTSMKEPLKLLTKISVSKPFSSIEWTPFSSDKEEHFLGLVIGGHEDGSITLWDMAEILNNVNEKSLSQDFGCISNTQLFEEPVNSLAINQPPNLLAVGTSQVNAVSINENFKITVKKRCPQPQKGGVFVSLNWNDRVNHILAAATNTGNVYIYDMQKQSLFLEIKEPSLEENKTDILNTQIVWSYDGAQIIIAYDHPEFNYLVQYHMKQPNAPSAMYSNGHNASIISLNKNPFDKRFLLSLGRDNVVTCWSLKTKNPLCKVQMNDPASQVIWGRKIKDSFICVRQDGKLYSSRINFVEDMNLYSEGQEIIPNWMIPKRSITFGFGGKLYKFAKDAKNNKENNIQVFKLNGHKELVTQIKDFLEKSEKNDLREILDIKIEQAKNQGNKNNNLVLFWTALKSVYEKNIDIFFNETGLNKDEFSNEISTALGHAKKKENMHKLYMPPVEETAEDLDELFNAPVEKEIQTKQISSIKDTEQLNTITEEIVKNTNWNVGNEKTIKKSLLLGDLESAVQLLFKNNRNSEALLIASTKPELFEKAKETYFAKENDLFVKSIFPAIINNNFDLLFDYNISKEWKEDLFYVNTYSVNSQDFKNFADKLGDKLSSNPDIYLSLVCYVLSEQYDKIINMIYNLYNKEVDKANDKNELLQNLFEQTQLVNKIINVQGNSNEIFNKIIYNYCLLLVQEGLNIEASRYLINIKDLGDEHIQELYERLYFNCELELGNSLPRPNPKLNMILVKKPREEKNNIYRNIPQNKDIINNNQNRFQNKKKPNLGGERPPIPPPNNQIPRNYPQFNPQPPKPIPKRDQVQNPPYPNVPPQTEKPPSFQNVPPNQPQNFNFGGNNPHMTRPPNIMKPPLIKPPKPGENITNPPRFNQKNIGNMNNINNMNNNINEMNNNKINNFQQTDNQFKNVPFMKKTEPPKAVNEIKPESLTSDEEMVYNYFNNYIETYNSIYKDENKRKDFGNKVNVLLKKLENHEIKNSLIKYLQEFMNLKAQKDNNGMRRLYMRIQSVDWDKNKNWMPLLEKIMNLKD